MSPITHFLAGWAVANALPLEKRERALVAVAGVLPDIDGLGFVAEIATRHSAHPLLWWSEYHHLLAHNALFAFAASLLASQWAKNRGRVFWLFLASFHLHLVCDVLGSRGPDGTNWTIPYLWPFSQAGVWFWNGQWRLDAWQNMVITAGLLALALFLAWRRGFSPLEIFSARLDRGLVETLRKRVPRA